MTWMESTLCQILT